MDRLIAIKLLWKLLCYLCYPSILIWWFRRGLFQILWILYPRPLSFNAQYFIPDTHCWGSVSYTRYILLLILDLALFSQAFIHLIISKPSFHDVHRSSPVAIGLSVFGYHYLATILTIQWESWRLITRKRGQLHSTGFSTLPLTIVLKGSKSHALTSGWSADSLDNLSCVCINK